MKIGYPCINWGLKTGTKTFRLSSYTHERLSATIVLNLESLQRILEWNVKNNIYFFRISSGLVPFASHPICTFNWQEKFANEFKVIGDFIKKNNIRTSMHPDQFVLINSLSEDIFNRSVAELIYHAEISELMKLDVSHKIQIHVGGVYGDKDLSKKRFIKRYKLLPENVKTRLVIENDDRLFSLQDCLDISSKTGIPILFDTFHHEILNNGESLRDALNMAFNTWQKKDGIPIIDYSSQEPGARIGNHTKTISNEKFSQFLDKVKGLEFDGMLEIKDKETSALKAISLIK